jgi:hypothetical protein
LCQPKLQNLFCFVFCIENWMSKVTTRTQLHASCINLNKIWNNFLNKKIKNKESSCCIIEILCSLITKIIFLISLFYKFFIIKMHLIRLWNTIYFYLQFLCVLKARKLCCLSENSYCKKVKLSLFLRFEASLFLHRIIMK